MVSYSIVKDRLVLGQNPGTAGTAIIVGGAGLEPAILSKELNSTFLTPSMLSTTASVAMATNNGCDPERRASP